MTARAVIAEISNGSALKVALEKFGMTASAFNVALSKDREAALAYVRAQELRSDLLADETIGIADTETDAQRARNRIDARKWLASKHNSKRYGDRIDLNVTQTLDIGATLAEAKARLRPISDQTKTIDAQYIDLTDKNESAAIDRQSNDQSIFD